MKTDQSIDDGWSACPPGELVQLAAGLRQRRRRRIAVRTAAVLSIAVAIFVAGRWAVSDREPPVRARDDYLHAGIYCSEVRSLLVDYRAGNLPGDLQSQVKAHLAECPPCRARLNATAGRPALRRGAYFANSPKQRGHPIKGVRTIF
ncbi:MAG TPA: zf-HC2 domain-containing protein [Pirellulales bacterium]|nr:zf-HC2 domain-containing protein [Pirellulales bacterium]